MRKLFVIPLSIVGFVILAVAILYIWLTQSPWLRDQLLTQVNRALEQSTDLRLAVGGISGDLISGATLEDVVLVRIRGAAVDTLVQIPRADVEYDIRALLPQRRIVRRIDLYQPNIWLPHDSIQNIFRKASIDISGKSVVSGSLELTLDSVAVHRGTLWRRGELFPLADSIEVSASFASYLGEWALAVAPSRVFTSQAGPADFEGRLISRDGSWWCDSLSVRTSNSSFVISGDLNRIEVRSAIIDMQPVSEILDTDLEGRIALSGFVEPRLAEKTASGWIRTGGTFQGYTIENLALRFRLDTSGVTLDSLEGVVAKARFRGRGGVNWDATPPRWDYAGLVERFDLSALDSGTLSTQFSGQVVVTGHGTKSEDLRIRAEVELGPGRLDKYRFESASGSLGATVDSLWIAENFALVALGVRMSGGGTIAFDDSIDVFASVIADDLRSLDSLVFVDSLAGRAEGHVYLTGLTHDPDLAAFLNSDTLRLFNLITNDFDGRVFVPHFLTNPGGEIEARWGTTSTWGVMTDSIELHAHLSGRRIDFDWARWYTPGVDVEGAGTLDWSGDTIPIAFYPLTVRWENQTYSASDSVLMLIDTAGVYLTQFAFEGPLGILRSTGRLNFNSTFTLEAELDRFRIANVRERFFPRWDIDGIVTLRGQLWGSYTDPAFDIAGDVSELVFEGTDYGNLEAGLSYRDSTLTIEWSELDSRYFHASGTGTVPVDLSLERVNRRILEGPISGQVDAYGDNLDPLTRFLPQTVESVHGKFSLQASVSGTTSSLRFAGEGTLTEGTIKAIEIATPLEDVVIDVALRHDTILVRRGTATMRDGGRSGNVEVRGSLRAISLRKYDYNLSLVGRSLPARLEYKDLFVITDMDVTVTGITPPTVAGTLKPDRIEDREPFGEPEERPVYDTTLWDWDLALEMPEGGYTIRNEQIEAELTCDLRILRRNGQISYIGTAELIRGKIYLLDKTGRITRGILTFDDPVKADPLLDLDVTFRIQQPRVASQTEIAASQFVDLNLHIGGRASEPLIKAEGPYSEQDVLLLLAANTTALSGDTLAVSDPLANRLKFAATGVLFLEVQRLGARRLGLETLEINAGANPFDASITVGRYLGSQLYLYGTSPIDAGAGQEVGFEYRLSRRVFLEGNRDKNNLYRLNLHLNWEY